MTTDKPTALGLGAAMLTRHEQALQTSARTGQLPDEADIDPAQIEYGKHVLTTQGLVMSTAADPNYHRAYKGV